MAKPLIEHQKMSADPGNLQAEFMHNFTILETFESAAGKFSSNIGNVAFVDCHHVGVLIPILPIDFCNYAMQVNGVLQD